MANINVSYCKNCGCYIPDNWDSCPACHQYVMSTQPSPLAQAVLRGDRVQPITHEYYAYGGGAGHNGSGGAGGVSYNSSGGAGGSGYSLSQYRVVTRRPSPTYLRTRGIPPEPKCPGEVLFREDIQRVFVADENLQWVALMRYDELINRKTIYDGILGNASIDKIVSEVEELAERCKL